MCENVYDMIIVGSGPAGLTAGIYGKRAGLKVVILESGFIQGGQIVNTYEVDNYPGMPGISGLELAEKLKEHVTGFGVEIARGKVKGISLDGEWKIVHTKKADYRGKAVILAAGAVHRKLEVPGEEELAGMGVSYCATCDANFFTDLEVYVAGGGDAAVEEALYLTKFARKVTIIHRRDELRAAKSIQEKAFANPKITFLWDSVVEEVGGDGLLQMMTVKNVKTGELTKIEADPKDGLFGLFGFIGMIPNTGVFADKVETDDKGYIKTDEDMHTNVPGVYAVGDVRVKSLRQVVTAVADGAIAAVQVEKSMSEY